MRNRLMIGTAALVIASAGFAGAQDKPQPETTPSSGTIDIGGRFTTTDGDEARYERYRDLRDGVNANFLYSKETATWTFDVKAKNIGYRDGRYELGFSSKHVKFSAMFDQIPLNYSYEASSPYNCTAGACTLDAALRTQVQNGRAVGVPQNAGQLAAGSIYDSIANPFDLRSRRDTIKADLRISATNNLDFIFGVNTYKRSGNMPYGAGFAFNNAVELPLVIDNRETELTAAAEWASHQGMFHVGYEHDKFNQNIPSFTYDNPLRATDFCRPGITGQAPGTCYDPSGYVNGNGPAFGLTASPPSNSVDTVNWMGMVKLPSKTTANASFTMGANHQDAALIPWTTNSSINNAAAYAAFPGLAALPRDTAQMRVNYATGTMNVSSRAIKDVTLTARYRFNSRSDFTREFDAIEYVRFDAVPEETGGVTEPYNISHNTLDVSAAYTGLAYSTIRAGYTYDQYEHSVRATQGWKDNTARVSYDFVGNQYVTLRAQYEHTKRDTINLSVEDIASSGAQPDLRFYDEAARKSDRTTFIVEVTPVSSVGLDFNLFHGKDDYSGADPTQEFGLLNNKNTGWTVGLSYAPSMKVNLGADYGRETYDALQESRNANPAPDPTWTDPNRNWSLANNETVNTFSAYANLVKLLAKTNIRASYDLSDSDQAFVHGGPRIVSLTAANQFIPFPDVTNKWQRATIDVSYSVSNNLGLGASYWYEKFDVQDYATINTAGPQTLPVAALGPQTDTPRIDWLGTITTGYAARPYKGQTVFVRVFYNF
jgi:Putative outer membrane beta-barrel porin, MtrB/PioB